MIEQNYGEVHIKIKEVMQKEQISINKLAQLVGMERTQLKNYMNETIQRFDLSILARLCYVLQCDITDILEYQPPK